mmetsp:Transcript_25252/g.57307  ORF Transcript_25252/g.57307 Transcript_25252/m.57307 type:complete len:1005 (-) Transcript_25252:139-3153(-)|eukprot:CAMPEP_0197893220 /NCGR_PEP_ID=MMETSP1439-20131203/32639_1 /TAXON_ID=66791 /ORGANISM="Gonyaulax spinifera, Strain CCMP409" /LENGTH=1004 /DNA_ID=CAMNT_0043513477 /DNA_START=88 /DNA_END=3102 /DNA_ORIENTATION=-
MSLLLTLFDLFSGLKTELVIFVIAICTHAVLFGSYRFRHDSPKAKAAKTRPAESPTVANLMRAVRPLVRQGVGSQAIVDAIESHLKTEAPSTASAALLSLLEMVGRGVSADLLAAVRDFARSADLPPSPRLSEAILRGYLGMKLHAEFQEALGEAHASMAMSPSIAALAMRSCIARSDLKTASTYIPHLALMAEASASSPSAAPQQLLQQLMQLAAQKSAVPEMLQDLDSAKLLSSSIMETALTGCIPFGDSALLKKVEELACTRGIILTQASYGVLVSNAGSAHDAHRIFQEAVEKGSIGKDLLQAAALVASAKSDKALADAVVQHFKKSPLPQVAASLINMYTEGSLAGSNADMAVLDLFENHLADVDVLADMRAGRLVAEASLRCGRQDLLKALLSVTQEGSRRVMLLKGLASQRRLADAQAVFEACPEKTTSLYNAFLDACVDCKDAVMSDKILAEAVAADMADVVTYNTIIKQHVQCGDLGRARAAIETMAKAGGNRAPNAVTFNELIDATIKCGHDFEGVWTLIEEMKQCGLQPNSITCSILLKTIQRNSRPLDVDRTVSFVESVHDSMDEVLLSSVCEACIRAGRTDLLQKQLKRQRGSHPIKVFGAHTFGSLVRAYGVLGDLAGAWDTWREMRSRHVVPTSITIGCMVEALVSGGDPDAGYELIHGLTADQQTRPLLNAVIYCSVLKGFCHQKRFDRVWAVHEEMQRNKVQYSIVTFNALIDACARGQQMVRVTPILEEMARQNIDLNVVTYSTILKGYCHEGRIEKAFELLDTMKKSDAVRPDEITYNTLIDGCAQRGLWDTGILLLQEMQEANVAPSAFTLTVLVKLASRSRRPEKAFELCDSLSKKYHIKLNMHVYNNLIQTCTGAGQRQRAIHLLEQMLSERVRPDVRTYKLILLASMNAGEVQDVAGLVRAATGLKGAHSRIDRFGTAAQPRGGLPCELLSEVLHSMASHCGEERLAMQLMKDLKTVSGVRINNKILASLTSKVIRTPITA